VLRLLVRGRTNKEIAAELIVSVRTVESHRANLYAKTGAHSRSELVLFADRHGLT
jgi:two-component system, NarL family, response regulator NreC